MPQTNHIIGVIAPKGSGKSTVIAQRIVSQEQRVAIYDPQAARDFQYRYAATHIIERDLCQFHQAIAEDEFRVLYRPDDPFIEGEEYRYKDFPAFIGKCYKRCELIGPMHLIVDEAHFTCSRRTMPFELMKVTTMSRSVGLDVTWCTQRFSGVNTWLRGNADEYWFFRLASPGDLDIAAQVCGSDVADQISNLRRLDANATPVVPGELLIWSSLDGSVQVIDLAKERSNGNPQRQNRLPGEPALPQGPPGPQEPERSPLPAMPGGSGPETA